MGWYACAIFLESTGFKDNSDGWRFCDILHEYPNISCWTIWWDFTPEPKYFMVADYVRHYTITTISHDCRFREILHNYHNISGMQISWDFAPLLHYLIVEDFLCITWEALCFMVADLIRYCTRTTISNGSIFHYILHQNHNILRLKI